MNGPRRNNVATLSVFFLLLVFAVACNGASPMDTVQPPSTTTMNPGLTEEPVSPSSASPTIVPTPTDAPARPTATAQPSPTPTPRAVPVPDLNCEGCSVVVLAKDGLRNIDFRRNQQFLLVGCYFDEQIDGPRGPRASRELVFSHKYQARIDDQVVVNWSPSATRDWPTEGCYEIATTYTGHGDYVYCPGSAFAGCRYGLGGIDIQMHTFKMLDHVEIPSGKWDNYRSVPPTPTPPPTAAVVPTPTPSPTPEPTATPLPDPTATRPPTATPAPMPTLIPTPTATPVPTPTPVPTATPTPEPRQWEYAGHWHRDLAYESVLNEVLKSEGSDGQAQVATLDADPSSWAADLSLSLGCIADLGVAYLTSYSWVVPPSVDTYAIGMWNEKTDSWAEENLGWYKNPLITDDGSAAYITNRTQLRQIIGILETAVENQNPDLVLNIGMFDSENEEVQDLWGEFDPTGLEDVLQYLPCF